MENRLSDARIVRSWNRNAAAWVGVVRDGKIKSRRLATDQAAVDAVVSRSPHTVLDVGCGEGWLARALASRHIHAIGIDVSPELVEAAQTAGGGEFRVMSYEQFARDGVDAEIDVAVANFSLLGDTSVELVFGGVHSLLGTHGSFVVQTLHPLEACGESPYRDGWREGSWAGFGEQFTDPAPWYFRTMESWVRLFTDSGFRLAELREPLHPVTGRPASVIFIAEPVR